MKLVLVWFRRDLRLADHTALHQALQDADSLLPVYILDPALLQTPEGSPRRTAYLLRCLDSLSRNLEHAGSRLIVRVGSPLEELPRLIRESGAEGLYWNEINEPGAQAEETQLRAHCQKLGVTARSFADSCIMTPGSVLKSDGTPYLVFTPYSKAWLSATVPPLRLRPKKINSPRHVPEGTLPGPGEFGPVSDIPLPPAGEKAAHEQLKLFMQENVLQYDSNRDFPARDRTSRLSIPLNFGCLSPRTVLEAARRTRLQHPGAAAEIDVFIKELIWRDFYKTILVYHPHSASTCFKQKYDALEWENNSALFQAWCAGRTGYPIVDAAMRQLNETGWMHNRLRMIVSSFLTKDLLVCWQWGERYFMKQLLDGDLAANAGSWQWAAGTGTDAQPYFRIFNPHSQAEKFDPEGLFIERYVPEINSSSYARPIVTHNTRRAMALAMFQKIRD